MNIKMKKTILKIEVINNLNFKITSGWNGYIKNVRKYGRKYFKFEKKIPIILDLNDSKSIELYSLLLLFCM